MKALQCSFACLVLALCGCATNPPVTYQYAPVRGLLTASVVQSLACDAKGTSIITASAPATIAVIYRADTSQEPWKLMIRNGSSSVDTDVTVERWEDGRLKSINSVSTGQGEAIVKAAVAVASFIVGTSPLTAKNKILPVCRRLKNIAGKDDVVSLTFSLRADLSTLLAVQPGKPGPTFTATGSTPSTIDRLSRDPGDPPAPPFVTPPTLAVTLPNHDTTPVLAENPCTQGANYCLSLQRIRVADVAVRGQKGEDLGSAQVIIPDPAPKNAWTMPIPAPAAFGKSTFEISVAESGAVTKTHYAKEAGTAGVFNAVGSVADAFGPRSDTEKLTELKTKNDIVAETNRAALCQAKPAECK